MNYSFENVSIFNLIKESNISLSAGKKYGIIGKNGAGKSTLMKYLQKQIGDDAIYIDQYVTDDLKEWYEMNIVDIILKSNTERYNLLQKIENIEYQEQICQLEIDKDEPLVKVILRKLGFSNDDLSKNYSQFSGGWKSRINLARALYMKPKVLLLDEPTNHLDMEALIWLEDYLLDFKSIVVVISHNVHFLNSVCTNIIYLNNCKLETMNGNYNNFMKIKKKEEEKLEKDWQSYTSLKKRGKHEEANNFMKKRNVRRPDKPYIIRMNFEPDDTVKSPYIKILDVSFSYPNKQIIKNLDFFIEEDTRATIVGLNGCGKSTLIKLITGHLTPQKGEIIRDSNLKISYFGQHNIENLPSELTPVEYLQDKYGLEMQEIRRVLGNISLESTEHKKKIGMLSGGQKARIVFSEIIIEKPNLILLDEPTNHLDLQSIEALINSINEYTGAVIIISHDIDLIEKTECDIFLLEDNTLKRLDTIDEYIEQILED
jgi:ATP-binding cassette subfamily F protein 1